LCAGELLLRVVTLLPKVCDYLVFIVQPCFSSLKAGAEFAEFSVHIAVAWHAMIWITASVRRNRLIQPVQLRRFDQSPAGGLVTSGRNSL
jgi:hypothetical protein